MYKSLISVVSMASLAACGGSGGGDGEFNTGPDFDALGNAAIEALDGFDAASTEGRSRYSAVEAEPEGDSIYEGVAVVMTGPAPEGFVELPEYAAVGSFEVTANFGEATVNGTADGFFEIENPGIARDVADGDVDPTDLVNAGSIEGSFAFDLDIEETGGFATATGSVVGSLTAIDDTLVAIDDADAEGVFLGDDLDAFQVIGSEAIGGEDAVDIFAVGLR